MEKAFSLGDILNITDNISVKPKTKEIVNDDINIIDTDWINSRFMTPDKDLDDLDKDNRFWSTSKWKFTDTTLGGNIGINPRPQFTRYCDIKGGNRAIKNTVTINSRSGNHGMGRYYSESLDDNAQTIFMEFGIPKFNSLIDFFTRAIDYEDSYIANNGRVPVGYKIGQFLGAGVMLAAFPLITLSIWAVKLVSKLIIGNKNFDYYYLEPAMHMYWGAVNNIITNLATEMGILAPELMNDGTAANKIGVPVKINQKDLNDMKELLPGLLSDNNYIDVFAIATRAQTIANQQLLKEREFYELGEESEFDFNGYVKTRNSIKESSSPGAGNINAINSALSFNNFLKKVTGPDGLFGSEDKIKDDPNSVPKDNKFIKNQDGSYPIDNKEKEGYLDKLTKAMDAGIKDGGLHAVFYVDYTGSVSESFSNSVGNISVRDKLKNVASGARNVKFDLAGGNIVDGAQDMLQAGKNVLAGALDSVTYGLSSVITTITGGGYIDIPKKWEDSDMSLPQITYNMQLISPYGNTISQLQNIYIPLAMLLAGTLPLSAGKSSYTSPFICSLYTKGIQNIKLGMITSLSITRGTSNLGFNKQRKPLAIDISFTVTDFSTLITAPVNSSLFDIFNASLQDDTPLANYLATLGSRDLLTSKYTLPKIKLRASRMLMKKDQMISPASWGLRMGEGLSGLLSGVVADRSLSLQYQK